MSPMSPLSPEWLYIPSTGSSQQELKGQEEQSSRPGLYGETIYSRMNLLVDHRPSPSLFGKFKKTLLKILFVALVGPLLLVSIIFHLVFGVLLYPCKPSILGSMFSRIYWDKNDTAGLLHDFKSYIGESNTRHYVPIIAYTSIEINADLPAELTRNWLQPGARYEGYYTLAHAADESNGKGIRATVPLCLLKFQYRDPKTGEVKEVTQTGGYPLHQFLSSPRTIWLLNMLRSGSWYRKLGVLTTPTLWLHSIPQILTLKDRGDYRSFKFNLESLPWSTLLWYAWGEEESCRFAFVPQNPTVRTEDEMKGSWYQQRLAHSSFPMVYDLCIQKKKREPSDRDAWHVVDERKVPMQKIGTMTVPRQDMSREALKIVNRKARINIADNPADMQVLGPHVARIHLYDVMQANRIKEKLTTAELVKAVAANTSREAQLVGILADRFASTHKITALLEDFDDNKDGEFDKRERDVILNEAYTAVESKMKAHTPPIPCNKEAILLVWTRFLGPDHNGKISMEALVRLVRSIQHMSVWRDLALDYHPLEAPNWLLDRFSRAVLKQVLKKNEVPITAKMAGLSTPQQLLRKNTLFGISFPKYDHNVENLSVFEKFKIAFASSVFPYPVNGQWKNRREAVETVEQYFGKVLMKDITPWNIDTTTDEATSRFAFLGMGAALIRPAEDADIQRLAGLGVPNVKWKLMLDYFTKYPTHPGVQPMGADAFFAPGKEFPQIVAIIRCGKLYVPPSNELKVDPEWEWAKFAFRSTVFCMVTVVHHFVYVHATSSNVANITAQEQLPATHPIRILINPFIFGATAVNQNAVVVLLSENGVINRRCWTYDGIKQIVDDHHEKFNDIYRDFEKLIEANGTEELKLPYGEDGKLVWKSFIQFVHEYLLCFYDLEQPITDEHIIRFYKAVRSLMPLSVRSDMPEEADWASLEFYLVHTMFQVTANHNQVGQIVEYSRDPFMLSWRLIEGVPYAPPQVATQFVVGVLSTGAPMPQLLDPDWANLHFPTNTDQNQQAHQVFVQFQKRMNKIGLGIDAANQSRRWPFGNFSPTHMQSSVSV